MKDVNKRICQTYLSAIPTIITVRLNFKTTKEHKQEVICFISADFILMYLFDAFYFDYIVARLLLYS